MAVTFSTVVFAQDFSNKGKDFWVGYGSHVNMYNATGADRGKVDTITGGSQSMVLYFTSDQNAKVTVEIPNSNPIWKRTYDVIANTVTISDPMPKTGAEDARITTEGKSTKGIHITSDANIIAYAHIYNGSVSGASLLFPVNTLARDYYSINYNQVSNNAYSYDFTYVIATEDSTYVEITPSVNTFDKNNGETFTVLLNKGEIYNIFGRVIVSGASTTNANTNGRSTGEDLTGTRIRSVATATSTCKKIAVFSGSGKICITSATSATADNYMQQAFPANAWGKKYITVPTAKMPNNIFRIAVSDKTAKVKINGTVLKTTPINDFYYDTLLNSSSLIESDLPIMVAQYITSTGAYGNNLNNNGDPEMIYLSPIEQTIKKVTINSTPYARIVDSLHYVNIIIPKEGVNSLKVDGVSLHDSIPSPYDANYVYFQYKLKAGSHTIVSDSGFNAIAYGYGATESYGYNAGTNVIDLYQKLSVDNQFGVIKVPATCKGTPFKVSITLPYKPLSIQWKVPKNDSIPRDYAPKEDSTYLLNGKTIYRYSLPKFLTIDSAGNYSVQVLVNNPTADGCSGEQEIDFDLVVYGPPKAQNSILTTHCIKDSVFLNDKTIVVPDDPKIIDYKWLLGTDTVLSGTKVSFLPKKADSIKINYFIINEIGCLSDTVSQYIYIDSLPKVNFGYSALTCQFKDIVFSDSSSATGKSKLQKWVWDFADFSNVDTLLTKDSVVHHFDTLKNYKVGLSAVTENGCLQKTIKSVTVNPNPLVGVKLPNFCLRDGQAVFTDTSKIIDNSGGFTYLWDFGDAANTAAKNTDTASNPKHLYKTPGDYTIIHTVTSNKGCVSADTVSFTVNGAIPKAHFIVPKDSALCSNELVSITNKSTVDIGKIGKLIIFWDYDRDTTNITVDDNASFDKAYTHSYAKFHYPDTMSYKIKMLALSGGTCISDSLQNINIVPPPEKFTFSTFKDYVCLADTLNFNYSTLGGTPPYSYTWKSDQATAKFSGDVLNGLSPSTVKISLVIQDAKNCIYPYDNLKSVEVRDIPKAVLKARDTVVCNGDPITLVGSNTMFNKWLLNKSIENTSTIDTFSTSKDGTYELVVNDGFCNSLASNSILITKYDVPFINLSYPAFICINTPEPISTNAFDKPNLHYAWDLGDGSKFATAKPVSHTYTQKGKYAINVKVTNDFCPSYNYDIKGDSLDVVLPVKPANYTYFVLADIDTILHPLKVDSGYTQYTWLPNINLSNNKLMKPNFKSDVSITYLLTRTDSVSKCKVVDNYYIDVSNTVAITLPKAFTPNGDNLNDLLKIEYGAGVKQFNYLQIFNRWGNMVFYTKNINEGWDGKYLNNNQEMDAYNYVIDFVNYRGEHVNKTGSVILIR